MSGLVNLCTLIVWGAITVTSDVWWVRLVGLVISSMAACNIIAALDSNQSQQN